MTKPILALAALGFVAASCNSNKTENGNKDNSISLIGKRATLSNPDLTANVHYLNDSTIHWKTTATNDSVAEQTNALTLKKVDNTKYFANWVEDDGTTVSQIIDLEKKTVKVFLTFEDNTGKRVSQLLEGTYKLEK